MGRREAGKEQDEQQGKVLIVMKHESDLVG